MIVVNKIFKVAPDPISFFWCDLKFSESNTTFGYESYLNQYLHYDLDHHYFSSELEPIQETANGSRNNNSQSDPVQVTLNQNHQLFYRLDSYLMNQIIIY
jgi:hypothetical protein